MKRYLIGFLLILLFLVMSAISATGKDRMTFFFDYFSYYIIFLMVLLWGISAVRLLNSLNLSIRSTCRQNAVGVVAALLMVLVIFFTVKTDFRTLSDETNLLSVSKSMVFKKEIRNVTMGKYYYDNNYKVSGSLPKRPFVYPFLTSVLHSLIGFRAQNAFIVNYIALFLFLAGIFIVVRRYTDILAAVSALFLICSYPVITLYAACAGFDFINAFFFYLAFASLFLYIKNPSKEKFTFMWLTFLVLSNTRYESVVYFTVAVFGLLVLRQVKWQTVKEHFSLICITPLLMLPFLWQRILLQGKLENPPGVPAFSVGHFFTHIQEFLEAQLDFTFYLPYATVLNYIGLLSLLILIYGLVKYFKKDILSSTAYRFITIFGLALLTSVVLIFSHYYGRYTHPVSARFFIILSIALALAPVGGRKIFPNLFNSKALLVLSLVAFLLYHPIAMEDRFTNTLTQNREFRQTRRFISALDDDRVMIITSRPGQFVAMGHGAIKFSYANSHANVLYKELQRGLYSDIIVMQRIEYRSRKPMDDYTLSKKFRLRKLDEVQITKDYFMRISKVAL